MKRPAKLRLLGKNWHITYGVMDTEEDIGECDIENQSIKVKAGLKLEQERSTLLHECIHAISDSLGLGLTEKQVQGLESGLYDLLVSNPQLVSYLKKKNA